MGQQAGAVRGAEKQRAGAVRGAEAGGGAGGGEESVQRCLTMLYYFHDESFICRFFLALASNVESAPCAR
jgi:hypothetical protein